MADDVAIKVNNVHKTFMLPHEKKTSVKSLFVSMFHGKRTYEKQHVLKGVSFEIKKGEFFGIVGRNGSGKSTLLKMLAGIYEPDKGSIQVNGKLTPFIELGVGFNPELTGRENVFLNGALLGFNREEMAAMYDEIVEFAELEKFMDQKLKNYSSGMQVRLAFSIAIRANTSILLLDEVLAVGDEAFQRKCYEYFTDLKKSKKTVILVTHSMSSMKRFCDKAMLINDGKVVIAGEPEMVGHEYERLNAKETKEIEDNTSSSSQWGTKDIIINNVYLRKNGKKMENIVAPGDSFEMVIEYKKKNAERIKFNFSLGVLNQGFKCFDISTYYSEPLISKGAMHGKLIVIFKDLRLLPGVYECNMSLFSEDMFTAYHSVLNAYTLNVLGLASEVKATGIVKTETKIVGDE